jgi:hypothetical protein
MINRHHRHHGRGDDAYDAYGAYDIYHNDDHCNKVAARNRQGVGVRTQVVVVHILAEAAHTHDRERRYSSRRQRVPSQASLKKSATLLPRCLLKQSWFCSWFISLIDDSIKYQRQIKN